jgi:hypothetical protein
MSKNRESSELERRNLLSTITECLSEHTVELTGQSRVVPMYLIEVIAPSSLSVDFFKTYGQQDGFRTRLVENLMGNKVVDQRYGVLLDTDLRYTFAFNRTFADIDKKKKRINFESPEEVLLRYSKGGDDLYGKVPEVDLSNIDSGGDTTLIRYSLSGRKPGQPPRQTIERVDFDQSSLIDRVKNLYERTKVNVQVDGKVLPFFLINVEYNTNTKQDFLRTYGREVESFQERIAEELLGISRRVNNYTVLVSPQMQMQFAFNNMFASYDPKSKTVIYTPAEEVLVQAAAGKFSGGDSPKIFQGKARKGRGTRFRYSLTGK